MVEVLLVELEGVIVDTREARRAALLDTLAADGVATDPTEYDDLADGLSPRQAAAALLAVCVPGPSDHTRTELMALRAERAFMTRIGKGVTLRTGAAELLQRARGRARLALVTRASRRVVDFVLALGGLDHLFDAIVTADDVLDPKPSPEGYRIALERLRRRSPVVIERCLALEDSLAGVRAAHALGIHAIIIGEHPAHRALEADGCAHDLADASLASLAVLAIGNARASSPDPHARGDA